MAATALACRPDLERDLDSLVDAAPVHRIPEAAALHRVPGSVMDGLQRSRRVPQTVLDALETQRRQSAAHHLVVTKGLNDIAGAWNAASIEWLVMKGPAVAATLYPDVGSRAYGDLDLLVGRRDLGRATAILEQLGYQHANKDWALAERMMASEFTMRTAKINVDLHWHLLYSSRDRRAFRIDPDTMLDRARCVEISGRIVPTFDEVDTVLTIALHAARSGGHRLVWLKDIERSLEIGTDGFDLLVKRAREFECTPAVGLMLLRARNVLDARVPNDVVHTLTTRSLRIAERTATATTNPIQMHERDTSTRLFTRSVKSSVPNSLAEAPARLVRTIGRRVIRHPSNETSDQREKDSFMRAVAESR